MATETQIEVHRGRRAQTSIFDEIERMREAISRRAYQIFQHNGHNLGREIDNWLQAEREMTWKPPMELSEKDGRFDIRVAIPGIDPKDIDVQVTQKSLLIKGEIKHEHKEENATVHSCEFESGSLFRFIELPKRIDPDKVTARFRNGMLTVIAEVAEEEKVRKVDVHAA